MRIDFIKIKNYRTLTNVNIDFIGNYCTISGKNNCGKTTIIKVIQKLLSRLSPRPWDTLDSPLIYDEDKTQWLKDDTEISCEYGILLSTDDDSSLVSFIEKISSTKITDKTTIIKIVLSHNKNDETKYIASINEKSIDEQSSKEIVTKFKSSNLIFLHNSTSHSDEVYISRRKSISLFEMVMSDQDETSLKKAYSNVQKAIKKISKEHKDSLTELLGKLDDTYQVEFSSLEGYSTRHMPFSINLKDKNVEVPLNDWGSGTQNRTHILMSILQANRIKIKEEPKDKITPVVIIEEPESFLHPSAQAEFGKILRSLSVELGIQIIVTTHSPYMLNQENPESNILLARKVYRNKFMDTELVETSNENWMQPFAEQLGLDRSEFKGWSQLFQSHEAKILLVEGDIDKEYIKYISENNLCKNILPEEVDIVPYGGKDVLKNTLLLKFSLSKFNKSYVTFDLDASKDVEASLKSIGLKENSDYCSIGLEEDGKNAIEGLLPDRIISQVSSINTDIILKLASHDAKVRKSAKSKWKRLLLDEFKKHTDYTEKEMQEFELLLGKIKKQLEI